MAKVYLKNREKPVISTADVSDILTSLNENGNKFKYIILNYITENNKNGKLVILIDEIQFISE